MMRTTPLNIGALRGTIYDFESAGDELPPHTHTPADVHISIVARGAFTLSGEGWSRAVTAGDVIDFMPGQTHGFVATQPHSRLVNLVK